MPKAMANDDLKCQQCGYKAKDKDDLAAHMKKQHPDMEMESDSRSQNRQSDSSQRATR